MAEQEKTNGKKDEPNPGFQNFQRILTSETNRADKKERWRWRAPQTAQPRNVRASRPLTPASSPNKLRLRNLSDTVEVPF